MKTLVSERGQVVIPKKIRETLNLQKGDELDIEIVGSDTILLKTVKRFKARTWRDYIGLGKGVVDAHLKKKKIEKEKEDAYL